MPTETVHVIIIMDQKDNRRATIISFGGVPFFSVENHCSKESVTGKITIDEMLAANLLKC